METDTSIHDIFLWLGRIFGVLNLPIAYNAVIYLSSAVLMRVVPQTSEQWIGFLTAITILAGVTAGLTVKRGASLMVSLHFISR